MIKPIALILLAAASLFAQPARFIHADGKQLVTPDGKPLVLRGINLGNWLVPEGYMFLFDGGPESGREIDAFFRELAGPDFVDDFWRKWRESYITPDDIRLIREAGFNSVRIPIHHALFVENGPGWPLLDRAVEWCANAGLSVVIDLHAAPAGQTGTNIDDSWGYPWLFESQQAQEQTVLLWGSIAARYAGNPAVLGYDLLNEPIPHFPALQKYNPSLEPLYKRIVYEIRKHDKDHVVILGGAQWDSNFKVFGPPFDSNSMYTFHKYWTAPTRDVIAEYLAYRDKYNVPIWLGESGENADEWVAKFVQTLESENVGWCFWPYKKMEKTSAVVSFAKPAHWDEIVAYGKLPGSVAKTEKRITQRPSVEVARAALTELLRNVQSSRCKVNQGYVKAFGMKAP